MMQVDDIYLIAALFSLKYVAGFQDFITLSDMHGIILSDKDGNKIRLALYDKQ